jgi:hydrogenase nickel incorporation protein HypA/HybF
VHELGLAAAILDRAEAAMRAHGSGRLRRVEVAVGELAAVLPDNLAFCFAALAAERAGLRGARLDVAVRPLAVRCLDCGQEGRPERIETRCPRCGSRRVTIASGQELEIVALEVE